jgi:hypothetical protein
MASIYGFSSDDAKRIGAAVRAIEGNKINRSAGGQEFAGPNPGVRMMLGKRSTATWAKGGASAVVTAYAGAHPATNSVGTVVAYNYFVTLGTANTSSNWVGMSNNGFGWIVIAAEC